MKLLLSTLVHKFANVFFLYAPKRSIRNDINHGKGRHSCESRNPGKHWIPGQARNDKPVKIYVVMYKPSIPTFHPSMSFYFLNVR